MTQALTKARAALRARSDPERAQAAARYFKTGPGEYGEGDVFLGLSVPAVRAVAREHRMLGLPDLATLLGSRFHEERLFALIVLVHQYERGDPAARKARFEFYLANMKRVNNWDLVDTSAPQIVGTHVLETGDRRLLPRLARSKDLWERRVAMVATFAFIRAGEATTPLAIAELLLRDEQDLIHKATGWMLREVGRRIGVDVLRKFLGTHAGAMPRTALRYAIERLSPAERKRWLAVPRAREAK